LAAYTKDQWYDQFYNDDNAALMMWIKKIRHGEIKIIVHEGRPIDIYVGKRIRIRKNEPKRNH